MDRVECPPSCMETCPECLADLSSQPDGLRTLFRCEDCHDPRALCLECVKRAHKHRPFDRILVWDKELHFWQSKTLKALGFVWNLGHGGRTCPYSWRPPRDMVVIHEHGIHDIPIRFCDCAGTAPETEQLMQVGLWPATWEQPRTATTLNALRAYHGLELQGQLNVHDYLGYLARVTDDVAPHLVKDRYREFSNSMRVYRYIHARRNCGAAPGEDLAPGSLAVLCPACPQPGINMRPGWEERVEEDRYLDALHFGIDGNFHLGLKDKDTDPDDVALSEGAAYFVNSKDFKTFLKRSPKPENESTTCNQFGAMGYGKYKGKVSGIIAITCRHMFMLPGSIVDLLRAEGYLYVDFALVSCLQRYLTLLLLKGCYDIACQYMRNLRKRLKNEFGVCVEELDSVEHAELPEIVAAVGKYHLAMHKGECRYKHSLHFLPGSAMDDGEPLERVWAITNTVGRRTKEMSAGHRHDVLNDLYSDLNTRRVLHIVEDLVAYLAKAEKRYASAAAYMEQIEKSIEKHHKPDLKEWRDEERAFKEKVVDISKHKDLVNPYEPPENVSLTAKVMAEQLKAERLAQGESIGVGAVGAVEQVLLLEGSRDTLRKKIQNFKPGDESARSRLADEVAEFRRLNAACLDDYQACIQPTLDIALQAVNADQYCSTFPVRDPADDCACGIPSTTDAKGKGKASASGSDKELLLASDLHSAIRTHPAMADLVKVESKLRQGQANEALDSLRLHLTTHLSLNVRRTQGSGVIHNTEADRRLQAKRESINEAKDKYRIARHKLLVLAMGKEDESFPVLEDNDCRAFTILSEEQRLGDSYRTQSWIWGDFSFAHRMADGDVKKFVIHSVKAHWFRQNALKTRWQEEVELRREEMWRTLRFFEHEEEKWHAKAMTLQKQGQPGAAAAARRQRHRITRLRDRARSLFPTLIQ
ncbi:hypothetical protein OH77DRAFT_1533775 [Trametes cingulata]|nr:hypothetical protein OH77DRAFT_1533775 [Trametes cingulata]